MKTFNDEVKIITDHFIMALIWSEVDDSGSPLDDNYDESDIAPEGYNEIYQDCESFYKEAKPLLDEAGSSLEQTGHDFCLTRNRHGVGFWDRGYGDIGDRLSNMCKPYGSIHLMESDGGLEVL